MADDTTPKTADFAALARALEQYNRGEADLAAAAGEAGLPEWAFLEEAQAMPDPMAQGIDHELPTFIREKR